MSRFSLLRGLPSAVNAEEPTTPALREFEAALCQRKDPSSSSADVSALSLLLLLRKASTTLASEELETSSRGSCADPIDPDAPCISPWGSESSSSDHGPTEILFVDEGHEVFRSEHGADRGRDDFSREDECLPGQFPPSSPGTGDGRDSGLHTECVALATDTPTAEIPFDQPVRAISAGSERAHVQHAEQLQALLKALGESPAEQIGPATDATGVASKADGESAGDGSAPSTGSRGEQTTHGDEERGGSGSVARGQDIARTERSGDVDDVLDCKLDGVTGCP